MDGKWLALFYRRSARYFYNILVSLTDKIIGRETLMRKLWEELLRGGAKRSMNEMVRNDLLKQIFMCITTCDDRDVD